MRNYEFLILLQFYIFRQKDKCCLLECTQCTVIKWTLILNAHSFRFLLQSFYTEYSVTYASLPLDTTSSSFQLSHEVTSGSELDYRLSQKSELVFIGNRNIIRFLFRSFSAIQENITTDCDVIKYYPTVTSRASKIRSSARMRRVHNSHS
jgi:hypothetical protein